MMKYLPTHFPSKQDGFMIPSHHPDYEQRETYPYTYTSTLLVEESDKHIGYHKVQRSSGVGASQQGGTQHLHHKKTEFYLETPIEVKHHHSDSDKVSSIITKKSTSKSLSSSVPAQVPVVESVDNAKQVVEARVKVFTLGGILVQKLDPLAVMYSMEWLQDAEKEFRQQMMSFLSEDEVSGVLGKTRCRDCLYYFEKAIVKPSKTRIASLGTFLSFWLHAKIMIGDVPYVWKTVAKDTTQVLHLEHLDDGRWIIKNDKI